ncbi:MAG: hypothetical protein EHM93_04425 [Bacteroidales bacterium]|nr:MAG: hypothetical protein EHM93_04425 [Bacteroidales bacterium]
MKIYSHILKVFILAAVLTSCKCTKDEVVKNSNATDYDTIVDPTLGAGFRYSAYGPEYNPGREYWLSVGQRMASNFTGAQPECVWIVGTLNEKGCRLNFPITNTSQYISGSSADQNEETFNLFDQNGVRVWLQIEPGMASVEELIHTMLKKYSKHKCIIGVGVDVEWYKSYTQPDGNAVTDEEANKWLTIAREYHPQYKLFLKHWLIEKMPPHARDGIVFVDDSQQFTSLKAMVDEFKAWGDAFKPAKVGFQYGYGPDKSWWGNYENPSKTIGDSIISRVSNTSSLFWVDFTVIDVFPPR